MCECVYVKNVQMCRCVGVFRSKVVVLGSLDVCVNTVLLSTHTAHAVCARKRERSDNFNCIDKQVRETHLNSPVSDLSAKPHMVFCLVSPVKEDEDRKK